MDADGRRRSRRRVVLDRSAAGGVAARGIFGTAAGPWSAGTGAVLLLNAALDPVPGGSSVTVKGGPGALTAGAGGCGARGGRDDPRWTRRSRGSLVRDGRAQGVVLADGTEIPATAVVSNADPRRTLLEARRSVELDPAFLQRMRNYRMPGTVAKVNLALSALPPFVGVANPADLHGRIHIGPSVDYLEKAFDASKYGEISREPYLDITIPSLLDPSLCPAGPARDVDLRAVRALQLAGNGDWHDSARRRSRRSSSRTLERYAPGISNAHRTPPGADAGRSRGHATA